MPLFLATPASADDITDATTALDSGNALVVDLTLQDNQAQAIVTSAEEQVLAAQATLDATDIVVTEATQAVADAQLAYDTQLITEVTHTGNGITATIYNDRGYNGSPPVGAGFIDHVQQVAQINFQWGGGSVLGGPSEDVQIKFTGDISAPTTGTYQFYGPADDGFILKINGNIIINDWVDKGGGGTVSQPVFLTANQPNRLEAWYYENGGGAWVQLNWLTDQGWQVVPATAFGTNTVVQTKDPNLLLVLDNAQTAYDNATLDQAMAVDSLNAAVVLYNAALEAKGITYNNLQSALAAIPTLQQNLATVIEAKRVADEQAAIAAAQAEQARLAAIAAQEAADRAAAEAKALADAQAKAAAEAYAAEQAYLAEQARLAAEKAAAEAAAAQAQAEADAKAAAEKAASEALAAQQAADQAAAEALAAQQAEEAAKAETDRLAAKAEQEVVIEPDLEVIVEPKTDESKVEELANIDPEKLTDAQVGQLVVAAEAVLATTEQGSPAYEKALEALAVAAVADDPQLPAELAAIPGAAAVLETFNALGNIGADMAPAVREEAEKTVIASVIAAGAAVNATVAAATTSSSTGSGGSSGSSGSSAESKTSARRREE